MPATANPIDPEAPNKASLTQSIIKVTNAERTARGLAAYVVSKELTQAAQMHTDDMARWDFFAHENTRDRGKFKTSDRVKLCGYKGQASENIVFRWFTVAKPDTDGSMAEKVVEAWMGSSGHRKNILSKDFKEMGAAMTFVPLRKGNHYKVLACQVFGRPGKEGENARSPRYGSSSVDDNRSKHTPLSNLAGHLPGRYENVPPKNDWHKVTIEAAENGRFRWKNAANISWSLDLRNGHQHWTSKDCPYGEMKYAIKTDPSGKISGIVAGNAFYRRVDTSGNGSGKKDPAS
ncbi:MAG: CAP domain-containing protein [Verrucomicrobiota bacterium]